MPPSTRLVQLVQYTNVAASTVRDIANTANEPFLQVVAALTITILNTVQTVRSNRDQLIIMVEEIHEILCLIIHLYSEAESAGTLPTVVLSDIAKFTETLQQIYGFLKTQQGMGKIKQLVKQFDSAAQLKLCQEGLRCSLAKFKMSSVAAVRFRTNSEPEPNLNRTSVQVQASAKDRTGPQARFKKIAYTNLLRVNRDVVTALELKGEIK
ncbi:hypothetical protein DFH08DRAFT_813172 [Mycena albidolilacea]|uniref:Uncharacterized protein n=1 Tax=Mycena albidolilacea TaxID=1033008 RepID=A0AAD6ZTL2_9AGAR|nr:hypothetical protein DFH08DRAFT_813172 [Mycena albidolilacea]